jgi:N-acetylglutamate synthase-like GNAT family acetyltransferase
MNTDVTVRLATEDDAAEISSVLLDAFGAYRENYTPEAFEAVTPAAEEIVRRFGEGPQWVVEINEDIVGSVSVTTEPEGLYIRSMAVRPDAQRRGVGHKLLEAVNAYADASGHDRIFLYTTYFVPGAKEMYEKHGYAWVRDTTADEWYGVPGLEMDRVLTEPGAVATGAARK